MTKREFNASAIAFCGLLLIVGFINKPRGQRHIPLTEQDAKNDTELQLIKQCFESNGHPPPYSTGSLKPARRPDGSISCAGG